MAISPTGRAKASKLGTRRLFHYSTPKTLTTFVVFVSSGLTLFCWKSIQNYPSGTALGSGGAPPVKTGTHPTAAKDVPGGQLCINFRNGGGATVVMNECVVK